MFIERPTQYCVGLFCLIIVFLQTYITDMAMMRSDYKYTYEYLYRYANRVVLAIKDRIRADDLIDTGNLLHSIDYNIVNSDTHFEVEFTIGDGIFQYGSGLPSEYGVYQDQGTIYIQPHYFFTAPIPGLTQRIFNKEIKKAIAKDMKRYLSKELKNK